MPRNFCFTLFHYSSLYESLLRHFCKKILYYEGSMTVAVLCKLMSSYYCSIITVVEKTANNRSVNVVEAA